MPRISWPLRLELAPQLAEVVELAVEDRDDVAALVRDRLVAGARGRRSRGAGSRARSGREASTAPWSGPRCTIAAFMRSTAPGRARPCRGVRRSRTCPVRKATRSCRATSNGRSTTAVWERYSRPRCARRPAGLRDRVAAAAAVRRRGRGAVRRARARGGGARAVRPPHALDVADRTRGRPAATRPSACCDEGRWLREQGLEPRFFCGGGWYMDAPRARARSPSSGTPTAPRPRGGRVPPAGAAARALDQPAWVRLDDGRRVLELPTTHSLGAAARERSPRALPPVVHVHFHDYELLDREAPARARGRRSRLLARRRRPVGARRARAPSARSPGPTYAPTDGARRARASSLAGCGSALAAQRALGPRSSTTRSGSRSSATARPSSPRTRTRGSATSSLGGRRHALTKVTSPRTANVYEVATDEPGRTATVAVRAIRARLPHLACGSIRRPACSRSTTRSTPAPDDHFLGGGERGGAVDLRGQVLPIKVSYECSARAGAVLREHGRLGAAARHAATSPALAFPGSPGGSGCQFGAGAQCAFPALADRAEVCVQGARLDEDLYVGDLAADARRLPGRDRPAARAAAVGARADQVARRERRPGASSLERRRRASRRPAIPLGWVLLDNPWETCIGTLDVRPHAHPRPGRR